MTVAILISNLRFGYRRSQEVLKGLDLALMEGEVIGILGPSGSGKSTLQSILLGFEKKYSGTARVFGREARNLPREFYRRVGVSFELPAAYQRLTARENLELFASLQGGTERSLEEVLAEVDLLEHASKRVQDLSKGMTQAVPCMRSASPNPVRMSYILIRSELLCIARDPALAAVLVMATLPLVVIHFFAAEINQAVMRHTGIEDASRLAGGFLVTLPALLVGWIFAMRFLEERDEGLEPVFATSVFGIAGFALARLAAASLIAFLLTFSTAAAIGGPSAIAVVLSICGSLQAIAVGCLLPIFAANRLEGIAYSKLLSPLALVALLALVDGSWRQIAVPLPTFHSGELLAATPGAGVGTIVAALTVNLAWASPSIITLTRKSGLDFQFGKGKTG